MLPSMLDHRASNPPPVRRPPTENPKFTIREKTEKSSSSKSFRIIRSTNQLYHALLIACSWNVLVICSYLKLFQPMVELLLVHPSFLLFQTGLVAQGILPTFCLHSFDSFSHDLPRKHLKLDDTCYNAQENLNETN